MTPTIFVQIIVHKLSLRAHSHKFCTSARIFIFYFCIFRYQYTPLQKKEEQNYRRMSNAVHNQHIKGVHEVGGKTLECHTSKFSHSFKISV